MKNDILGLSLNLDYLKFKNIDTYDFSSDITLLDYDIVIIDMNFVNKEYSIKTDVINGKQRRFQGNILIEDDDSFKLKADLQRRKKQILDVLETGKTILIIPPDEFLYAIYTGQKEWSGTGKNRKATHMVAIENILDILPFELTIESKNVGEKIEIVENTPFTPLFEKNEIQYYYNAFLEIESDIVFPLAYARNTKKIIAANLKVGKGNLMIIPPVLDRDIYSQISDTKYRVIFNKFLHTLDEVHEDLKINISDYNLPSWSNKYNIFDEHKIIDSIDSIDQQIMELNEKKESQKSDLVKIQKYKLLLTASGEQLEKIVHQVMIELGFEAKDSETNRADGIFIYNDNPVVIEIKGVSKSAAEKHVAQLEKWVAEYFAKTNKHPKGILIANTFRNKDISERKERNFPTQMLAYAKKREHCLLTTTQLLCLYVECTNSPEIKDDLIDELLSTVGDYEKFKEYSEYIKN